MLRFQKKFHSTPGIELGTSKPTFETYFSALWDFLDRWIETEVSPLAKMSTLCRDLVNVNLGMGWNLSLGFGCFAAMIILRVSTSMSSGLKREAFRTEDGIMIPYFYLTYMFSEEDTDGKPSN